MLNEVITELFQPASLLAIVAGTLIGVVIGSLPGLSATMAIALLIPVTFILDPIPGIILLVAVYTAGVYGGSISSILLFAPGTPANAASSLDGYPMTRQGQGLRAIIIATVSSVIGGLIGGVALLMFTPYLSRLSLVFGPQEYFLVAIFGLTIIGGLAGDSLFKGILAGLLGLAVSVIGIDSQSGNQRLTFGVQDLQSGVEMVPAMIGLFAVAQLIVLLRESPTKNYELPKQQTKLRKALPSFREWLRLSPTIFKSGILGTGVGVLPGAGGDIASWIAYNEAKRSSKNKHKFGKGAPEGIAAPETANNVVVGGALIPTLTLGIPGSASTAVLLGGLIMKGLIPGHELFTTKAVETYSIIGGFMIATLLMGVVGISFTRAVVRVVDAPPAVLTVVIMTLSVLGTYSIRNNMFDVLIMLIFGALGYGLRTLQINPAPVILGLILGPIAEHGFRQSQVIAGEGSVWMMFLQRPFSLVLILLIILTLVFTAIQKRRANIRKTHTEQNADKHEPVDNNSIQK